MADFENTQESLISDFQSEEDVTDQVTEKVPVEDTAPVPATAPLIDIDEPEIEETEELPVLSEQASSGVEEVNVPDIGEHTDEAIVDGFPAQTKAEEVSSVSTAPSLPTPTENPEGFEEISTYNPEKKDHALKSPLALWIKEQNLHPQVIQLIYWVELQRTTGVFGGVLLLLLSLRFYPLIGVVMTFALSLLVVAFLYRIGMTIVKAVQKTAAEHPFKHLLEEKIEISEETMQCLSNKARVCINEGIRQMQSLFLVRDTVASLKAMIVFWLTSYIASCVYFLTLCIYATIIVFTVPKLYEEKQQEIDQVFGLVMDQANMVYGMVEKNMPEKVKAYLKKTKSE